MKLPVVVIVGRMNVGKSTLFNRLSVDVKSLTYDYEGVTRDLIKDVVSWQGRSFELIDTGGVSFRKTEDPILAETRQRALAQTQAADLIIFLCDGTVGVLNEDREIAQMLHKMGKPVVMVINKTDTKVAQERTFEFDRLGFKSPIAISAQHGKGIADLLEAIVDQLPDKLENEEHDPASRVVILGKPNVGKSSLMNLLVKQERSIVANVPGTTREAISERVKFYSEDIQVTDTPGIRKKHAVKEPLETLMVKSSLRALEKADVVLLMVDKTEGKISDQELKLAFYAFDDLKKAVIILFNKTDITQDYEEETLESSLKEYQYLFKKIETLRISCITGENIGKILPLIKTVTQRYYQQLPEHEISMVVKEAWMKQPLYKQGQLLEIYSARQIKQAPITLLLKVNEPQWFGPTQLNYVERILRERYDLKSVPLRLITQRKSS
jgi:GTP-binding protein